MGGGEIEIGLWEVIAAFSKQFEKTLDELFRQRTRWLRKELGVTKIGKPPIFSRRKVNEGIEKLQKLASDAFSHKLAKSEFEEHVKTQKSRKLNTVI